MGHVASGNVDRRVHRLAFVALEEGSETAVSKEFLGEGSEDYPRETGSFGLPVAA
jgi:hypothetical protein